jgi:GTP cyclohydrolase I
MEVKKKFEKPQMEVVKLKPAYMVSACSSHFCPVEGGCGGECPDD